MGLSHKWGMHRNALSLVEMKLILVLEEMTENPQYREVQRTRDLPGCKTSSEDCFPSDLNMHFFF